MPRPKFPKAGFPSVVASLLLLLGAGVRPDLAAAEERAESPLREGAWASEFEFDPGYYSGYATLAIKRHFSPTRALRFGMNLAFLEEERDGHAEQRLYDPPNYPVPIGPEGSVDRHNETHAYATFLHLVREWPVEDRIAMFVELGPSFRYTEYDYSSEYIFGITEPIRESYGEVSLRRSVSVDLALGFEWFFTKRLSLGARYGAYAAYQWGAVTSWRTAVELNGPGYSINRDRADSQGIEARTTRATMTLAAYF